MLVVGGGAVAARKVAGLVAAGAAVTVVGPDVRADIVPKHLTGEHVTVERRPYRPGEVEGYWLVVTCTDDPAVQQQVFDDGERLGVWVNAADDPERCSFILPAVARRGPVVVSVSTSGTSPALAQVLRDRFAEGLPQDVERIAFELERHRAQLHAEGRSTEDVDWRPIVEDLLAD